MGGLIRSRYQYRRYVDIVLSSVYRGIYIVRVSNVQGMSFVKKDVIYLIPSDRGWIREP